MEVNRKIQLFFLFVIVMGSNLLLGLQAQQTGVLKAGAAKINITPAKEELSPDYLGIHDSIYSRAIVVDNGISTAALVTVDIGIISEQVWKNLTQRVEKELGIPVVNIMLTATHTHSVPFDFGGEKFEQELFTSVKTAKANLQPARIGYGTGVSYINVNRNIIDPKTRLWSEGPNYDGPSDKTVAVVSFESLDGTPIAVYYNYAMHAVTVGQLDLVSGDAPGATSRYIEESFDNKIVAVWSEGACGDQNPLYYQQTYDLREIRIRDYAKRGIDISNDMPPGGTGLDRNNPTVARLMEQQKQMILSMGQFLGEEVMHVMRGTERTSTKVRITGMQKIISCPGRKRTNTGRAGYAGTYEDTGPIDIRLGLLLIDDIAFTSVNGEVFNLIAQRLKKESPYNRTMMLTLTNGMGKANYIPNDAAYGMYTFEVVSSNLKPGFAEDGIVNGILDMMEEIEK